jgi:ribosomal protein S10
MIPLSKVKAILSRQSDGASEFCSKSSVLISSFDRDYVNMTSDFASKVLRLLGLEPRINCCGTKIRKWTVLSSPFAHKTARTQFESRIYSKGISFSHPSTFNYDLFAWYLSQNAPPNTKIVK